MKITLAELWILLDTTTGSLSIADRRDFAMWKFDSDQRRAVVNAILSRMNNEEVEITPKVEEKI